MRVYQHLFVHNIRIRLHLSTRRELDEVNLLAVAAQRRLDDCNVLERIARVAEAEPVVVPAGDREPAADLLAHADALERLLALLELAGPLLALRGRLHGRELERPLAAARADDAQPAGRARDEVWDRRERAARGRVGAAERDAERACARSGWLRASRRNGRTVRGAGPG
jgi:hypothetical protein